MKTAEQTEIFIHPDLYKDKKTGKYNSYYSSEIHPNHVFRAVVDGKLQIQIASKVSYCNISKCRLKSLEGCPKVVEYSFNCSQNPELESYEGGPLEIGQILYLDWTSIYRLPENLKCQTISKDISEKETKYFKSVAEFNEYFAEAYKIQQIRKRTQKFLSSLETF